MKILLSQILPIPQKFHLAALLWTADYTRECELLRDSQLRQVVLRDRRGTAEDFGWKEMPFYLHSHGKIYLFG